MKFLAELKAWSQCYLFVREGCSNLSLLMSSNKIDIRSSFELTSLLILCLGGSRLDFLDLKICGFLAINAISLSWFYLSASSFLKSTVGLELVSLFSNFYNLVKRRESFYKIFVHNTGEVLFPLPSIAESRFHELFVFCKVN